jgi:hypothetical protein
MSGLNRNDKMDPRFKLMLIFAGIGVLLILASMLIAQ